MVYPAPPTPKPPKKPFNWLIFERPAKYLAVAMLIPVLGWFIPGIGDEILGEISLLIIVSIIEIWTKVKASKPRT